MNVSGPAVAQAWSTFTRDSARSSGSEGAPPILVVLHDELEAPLGAITVRSGWASPRGHNGLKSIQKSLNRDTRWWRVGVGIGRPESRDPDVVAGYVLRKMSAEERGKVEGSVGKVVEAVERIGREAAKEGC
jgi:PTH1 family peptidyl-tRNA hydrolase